MPEDFSDVIPTEAVVATYGGHLVDIINPTVEMIRDEDVFKSLARRCRFGGFLDTPLDEIYSVAQHAVYVSRIVRMSQDEYDPMAIYHALHHDDPEYILTDIVSPMKRVLPDYKRLEKMWTPLTNQHFGVISTPFYEKMTHWADRICFMHEAAQFDRIDVPDRFKFDKLFDLFEGERVLTPSQAYEFFKAEHESLKRQLDESGAYEHWTAQAV